MFSRLWRWRRKAVAQDAQSAPAENPQTGVSESPLSNPPLTCQEAKEKVMETTPVNETTKSTIHGVYEAPKTLLDTNPIAHYYVEGRTAEARLDFTRAAEMYLCAHVIAKRDQKSSAIAFKWHSMRCVEYGQIYEKLLAQQNRIAKAGRKLRDGSIMILSVWDTTVIDKDIMRRYKEKLGLTANYNIVSWNETTKTMRFIHSRTLYGSSEPTIDTEWIITEDGKVTKIESPADPQLILHKWMLTVPTMHASVDRISQIRRSIRIEFLRLPRVMCLSEFPRQRFWETYVEPAIGNRNVGHLEKKYSQHLINLATSAANSRQGLLDHPDEYNRRNYDN